MRRGFGRQPSWRGSDDDDSDVRVNTDEDHPELAEAPSIEPKGETKTIVPPGTSETVLTDCCGQELSAASLNYLDINKKGVEPRRYWCCKNRTCYAKVQNLIGS